MGQPEHCLFRLESYRTMDSADDLIAKKVVNALVADAEPEGFLLKPSHLRWVLGAFKSIYQGLWVGGTLYLRSSSIEFQPNPVNRLVHKGDTSRLILLNDVLDVKDRFGVATRIVDVTCRNAPTLTFRCYGAKRFAEQIRAQLACG